jgi:2,3-dihydroxybenzoate decarboxylase
MRELAPWFDTCPIAEHDRLKIGRTNAQKLFKLQRGVSGIVERAA